MDLRLNPKRNTGHHSPLSTQLEGTRIWEWDLLTDSVYCTPDWKKLRGCDAGTMLQAPDKVAQFVHPDDKADRARLLASLRAGELQQIEFAHRVKTSDGDWCRVVERAHAICNDDQEPIRIVGFEVDASTIDQALRQQESSNLPDGFIDSLPAAVLRFEHSQCVYVNEHWTHLTGQPKESTVGDGWLKAIHPDDRFRFTEIWGRYQKVAAGDEIVHNGFKGRYLNRDGSSTWFIAKVLLSYAMNGELESTSIVIARVNWTEEELIELSQRLHKVLKHSSIGIWQWFWEDERLVWDEKMHEIYGVDAKDFRGTYMDWSDRIHPHDLERVMAEDQCRAESNQQHAQEFRIVRPSGKVRHIYSNAYTELDSQGKPVRAIGINLDITDRRKAEFALLESENRLQRIADHLPGIVYRYFLDADGSSDWKYLSSQVRELFGIGPSELMENKDLLWQLIDPNDMERLRERMHRSAKDLSRFVEEFRITNSAGETRWYQASSQPQSFGNGGVVWDGVILEITDQKTAESELQIANYQLERITENVPGMIFRQWYPKTGGEIATFVSSRSLEMFGVGPVEALADDSKLWRWIHPEDVEALAESINSSVKNLVPLSAEYRVTLPNKKTQWYHVTGQPQQLKNGDVTLDGVVLDITDRKEAELANDVLAKATKTKDEFLANMSHELRTPLTSILAMTDGMQLGMFGDTTPKQMESLKVVEQSGLHLLDLINEVLDLAKIESGQTELEFSSVDVSELCDVCLNLVTQQAEQKRIEFSLQVPRNLPKLEADEKRIRRVLVNLLSNAVKFTPEGGEVKLDVDTLAATETDLATEILRFTVSDTGIGINVDEMDSLFERFVQVDSSLTRQHGGTGLGLSLVEQFVKLHGGRVRVTSEPGHGSRFTVDLPFRKASSEQAEGPNEDQQQSAVETFDNASKIDSATTCETDGEYQPLILLAEDNDCVAQSIIPILKFSKFRVLHAVNGKIAVEMAREHSPDLILMDIQMPEMDGLEATRRIRAIAEFSQLPIIAVSGFAKSEDSQRCADAGMNLFLAKPLRVQELIGNIKHLLEEQRTTNANCQ